VRPLSHCYKEKKRNALISLQKAENNDIAPLKERSTKNPKSLLECPTTIALVATVDTKAFNHTQLLKSYLVREKRIIDFHRQNNRKRHG